MIITSQREMIDMHRNLLLIGIIALLLVSGCSSTKDSASQEKLTVNGDTADVDELDEELDTSELDTLDSELDNLTC